MSSEKIRSVLTSAGRAARPFLPALASSLLYVIAFPSFNVGGAAWLAFVPLLLSFPFCDPTRSAQRAFLAGLLAHGGTLYWIYPTCRAAEVHPAVAMLAWISLATYMALYWGLFGFLAGVYDQNPAPARPFLLAATWVALEWVRSSCSTGFPWLLLAYSQWQTPTLIQTAEYGGPYLVSFAVILFNSTAAFLVRDVKLKRWDLIGRAAPALGVFFGLTAWSVFLDRQTVPPAGPDFSVSIAQGNIDQYQKWDQAYEQDILRVYTDLTDEAAVAGTDLIVWPETAVPGWVPNEGKYVRWVADLAERSSAHLLVGAASRQQNKDYNAVFLFSPTGDLLGQYRKRQLVPFGEVVPFQKILSRWVRVLNELGEFTGSDDWTVFKSPSARFSANICFESLFPDIVRGFVRRGAQVTVNMTNDGWYRDTAAPEQHFVAAVFRAVETRTWVVRAGIGSPSSGVNSAMSTNSWSSLKSR